MLQRILEKCSDAIKFHRGHCKQPVGPCTFYLGATCKVHAVKSEKIILVTIKVREAHAREMFINYVLIFYRNIIVS